MHNDSIFDMSYIKHICKKPASERIPWTLCGTIAYENNI